MRSLRAWMMRFGGLFGRQRREHELAEEMESHLQMHIEDNLRRGMSPQEGRRQALIQLGGLEQAKEKYRERRGLPLLETLWRDARYGARMLLKSPGFTSVAALTLALGIGANTAIFSVLEAQIWSPLPFPDSEHLVYVGRTDARHPGRMEMISAADYPDWLAAAKNNFADICAFQGSNYHNMPGTDTAELVRGEPVSSTFFVTLRMPLVLGRSFLPSEQIAGANREVILSYAFWQSHFASDPSTVGRTIVLDGSPYTIVGVAPAGLHFQFYGDPEMYVPLLLTEKNPDSRTGMGLDVIGRLKPGISLRAAQVQMNVIAKQLAKQHPQDDANRGIRLSKLLDTFGGPHQGLFFFAGAAGLVLLIACVNVASLLLARGLAREHEFAVRSALGAGRAALLRQLLVEGVMLGALGGGLGVLGAFWGTNTLNALLPFIYRHVEPRLDTRVLAFAVAVSVAAAILCALAPALFASRVNLTDTLQSGTRAMSSASGHRRLRNTLVVMEVTLAVSLLFGAGLFLNSFARLVKAPLGFDPHNLLSLGLTFSDKRYSQTQNLWLVEQQILERVRAVPGVQDAAFASQIPFAGGIDANFEIVGHPLPANAEKPDALFSSVSSNYFQLLKIPLLAGRTFDESDAQNAPHVVVVNENFAQQYFPDTNPLGAELEIFGNGFGSLTGSFRVRIVGIVQNTHMFGPNEVAFDFIYAPVAQVPVTSFNNSVFLIASTKLPASSIPQPVKHQISQVDTGIPVTHVATMDERVAESLRGARGNLMLIGAFAGLAVALVAVGIFGAIAYFVQQRTREFGIRLALGATPARILRLALRHSAALGVSGVALGVVVSLATGRLLGSALYLVRGQHEGLLYGVSVLDPLTLLASCAVLAAVLFVASYVPARRAMRVDPMVALRYE